MSTLNSKVARHNNSFCFDKLNQREALGVVVPLAMRAKDFRGEH